MLPEIRYLGEYVWCMGLLHSPIDVRIAVLHAGTDKTAGKDKHVPSELMCDYVLHTWLLPKTSLHVVMSGTLLSSPLTTEVGERGLECTL